MSGKFSIIRVLQISGWAVSILFINVGIFYSVSLITALFMGASIWHPRTDGGWGNVMDPILPYMIASITLVIGWVIGFLVWREVTTKK